MHLSNKAVLWSAAGAIASASFLMSQPSKADVATKKGYFISIDSLRGDHVQILTDAGVLNADHGIGWLYRTGSRAEHAYPVDITLTAPSHVSTITCSHPRSHGITANSFMVGTQKVNGFSYDIHSETFWEGAKRQNKKVLAIAYVGADGNNERRKADVGISYPSDALVGKAQTLRWDLSTLTAAQGWSVGALTDLGVTRETAATLVINGQTNEQRALNVLFANGVAGNRIYLDDDKDLTNGYIGSFDLAGPRLQVADAYYVEQDATSPISGYKKRVRFTLLDYQSSSVTVYASTASYNKAYPEEFRRYLDEQNLVWVDPYIPSSAADLSPAEYVKTTVAQDNFFADVAVAAQSQYVFDTVLFYQPRLDEFSHKYAGALSVPLNPMGANSTDVAFLEAFKAVDANVSRVMATFDEAQDVAALMGDHGMEPIKQQVNIGPFVREIDPTAIIIISGALVMLYPSTGDVDQRVGENLDRKLSALTYDGFPVNAHTHRKDQTPADQWQYGEATWAFTSGIGTWYTNNISAETFLPPPITGMHGHDADVVSNMATIYLLKAPGVGRQIIPRMSLIDALPTFANLMGIEPPANCEGHPVFFPISTSPKVKAKK